MRSSDHRRSARISRRRRATSRHAKQPQPAFHHQPNQKDTIISPSLEENHNRLKAIFQDCDDMIIRPLKKQQSNSLIVFFKSMVDQQIVDRDVLKPLTESTVR